VNSSSGPLYRIPNEPSAPRNAAAATLAGPSSNVPTLRQAVHRTAPRQIASHEHATKTPVTVPDQTNAQKLKSWRSKRMKATKYTMAAIGTTSMASTTRTSSLFITDLHAKQKRKNRRKKSQKTQKGRTEDPAAANLACVLLLRFLRLFAALSAFQSFFDRQG
jgi:hypothetical protein